MKLRMMMAAAVFVLVAGAAFAAGETTNGTPPTPATAPAPVQPVPGEVTQIKTKDTTQQVRTEAYVQPAPAHWHTFDNDFMKGFHNPTDWLEMGLDVRLREVYAANLFGMNEEWGDASGRELNDYHWQRYRTRWSTKSKLSEDVDFNTRLTWEFWGHCDPDDDFTPYPFFAERNYDFDEGIFDIFNVQIRNVFDMPLTLMVGRQEIILGTGWLVLDGTPGDGSRTIFFDAVRGTYGISDTTKLDLIYIQQYDDEEEYIEPFNHHAVQDRRHLTQKGDERGFIFYLTNITDAKQQQELYYIYKNEEPSDWAEHYSPGGQDADIHTIGGRLAGPITDHWSYSIEGAKQFGDRNGRTLQGLGTNDKLMYSFNDRLKNEVHVGYEYLSGDDPESSADEKFDTLWGDWPQYQRGGDLQSYIWTFEGNLGEVTNLHRVGFGHSFKPCEVWTIATDYNLLWADENTFGDAVLGPFGALGVSDDSNFRGQMLSGIATYSCCKNFRTHFMLDYFIPGDYYDSPSGDDAYFARVNVEWTF
ncbi:MAG: alginate export family protein [Planctomycetaceae bacterium]|nr:alginate export family protein [Planctomycetaceae bacterium]